MNCTLSTRLCIQEPTISLNKPTTYYFPLSVINSSTALTLNLYQGQLDRNLTCQTARPLLTSTVNAKGNQFEYQVQENPLLTQMVLNNSSFYMQLSKGKDCVVGLSFGGGMKPSFRFQRELLDNEGAREITTDQAFGTPLVVSASILIVFGLILAALLYVKVTEGSRVNVRRTRQQNDFEKIRKSLKESVLNMTLSKPSKRAAPPPQQSTSFNDRALLIEKYSRSKSFDYGQIGNTMLFKKPSVRKTSVEESVTQTPFKDLGTIALPQSAQHSNLTLNKASSTWFFNLEMVDIPQMMAAKIGRPSSVNSNGKPPSIKRESRSSSVSSGKQPSVGKSRSNSVASGMYNGRESRSSSVASGRPTLVQHPGVIFPQKYPNQYHYPVEVYHQQPVDYYGHGIMYSAGYSPYAYSNYSSPIYPIQDAPYTNAIPYVPPQFVSNPAPSYTSSHSNRSKLANLVEPSPPSSYSVPKAEPKIESPAPPKIQAPPPATSKTQQPLVEKPDSPKVDTVKLNIKHTSRDMEKYQSQLDSMISDFNDSYCADSIIDTLIRDSQTPIGPEITTRVKEEQLIDFGMQKKVSADSMSVDTVIMQRELISFDDDLPVVPVTMPKVFSEFTFPPSSASPISDSINADLANVDFTSPVLPAGHSVELDDIPESKDESDTVSVEVGGPEPEVFTNQISEMLDEEEIASPEIPHTEPERELPVNQNIELKQLQPIDTSLSSELIDAYDQLSAKISSPTNETQDQPAQTLSKTTESEAESTSTESNQNEGYSITNMLKGSIGYLVPTGLSGTSQPAEVNRNSVGESEASNAYSIQSMFSNIFGYGATAGTTNPQSIPETSKEEVQQEREDHSKDENETESNTVQDEDGNAITPPLRSMKSDATIIDPELRRPSISDSEISPVNIARKPSLFYESDISSYPTLKAIREKGKVAFEEPEPEPQPKEKKEIVKLSFVKMPKSVRSASVCDEMMTGRTDDPVSPALTFNSLPLPSQDAHIPETIEE